MQKRQDTRINIGLVVIYFAIVIFGLMTLYSANSAETTQSILDSRFYRQLIWVMLSLALGILVIFLVKPFDLFSYIPPLYIFMLLLTIGVAIFGIAVHGSRSWLRIAGFSIQPSEFLKYATALFFARIIAQNKDSLTSFRTTVLAFIPVLVAMGAVMMQGDMGTALIFLSFIIPAYRFGLLNSYIVIYIIIYGIVFFVALRYPSSLLLQLILGIIYIITLLTVEKKYRKQILLSLVITPVVVHFINVLAGIIFPVYWAIPIGLLLGTIFFLVYSFSKTTMLATYLLVFGLGLTLFAIDIIAPIFYSSLKPHQKERIEYFINPKSLDNISSAEKGVGYNIVQAKLSISAGGLTGRGYLKGTHNKLKYVPAKDTDYIFCTVAEELGFVGNVLLFTLFTALFIVIISIAEKQQSVFSQVYGYSVVGILFFHYAINIGSTLSLLPVIGIPLPFFSYGGSATMSFTLMLATLLMLDNYRNVYIEDIF